MKKAYTLSFISLLLAVFGWSQNVTISSLSATSGQAGENISIYGTGFDPLIANNAVYFENVKATISSCTATQIDVEIPKGSPSMSCLHVTNLTTAKTGSTASTDFPFFSVRFPGGDVNAGMYSLVTYDIAGGAQSVFSGDFDGDGFVDVGVLRGPTSGGTHLLIMKGNGTETLSQLSEIEFGTKGKAANTGDFDNDGDLDIIIGMGNSSNGIVVMENDGSGDFSVAQTINNGLIGHFSAGDFNNDGFIDFVCTGSWYTKVLLNNGDMTFSSATLAGSSSAESVATGDMNEDGNIDILVPVYSSGQIKVFAGEGDGTFTLASTQDFGANQDAGGKISVADINGDGHLDAAGTGYWNGKIGFAFGDGAGNFDDYTTLSATDARDVRLSDVNGDGIIDIQAMRYSSGSGYYIFQGNGNGTFHDLVQTSGSNIGLTQQSSHLADINQDGLVDVIQANYSNDFRINFYKTEAYEVQSVCGSFEMPNGDVVSESGIFSETVVLASGTELVYEVDLTVIPASNIVYDEALCAGSDFTFYDGSMLQDVQENVSRIDYTTVNGCENSVETNIVVTPVEEQVEELTLCAGSDYTFPDGSTISNIADGMTHVSAPIAAEGCMRITTALSVVPTSESQEDVAVCEGSDFTFPDNTMMENLTDPVTYLSEIQTDSGCDYITTVVAINPNESSEEEIELCPESNYTFPDGTTQENLLEDLIYVSEIQTAAGCENVITTSIMVHPYAETTEEVVICQGEDYTFPDNSVAESVSENMEQISTYLTPEGCTGYIITNLYVNESFNSVEETAICAGENFTYPDGTTAENLQANTTHVSSMLTPDGCPNIVTTNIMVNPTIDATETYALCAGENFTFLDGTEATNLSENITHVNNLTTPEGCAAVTTEILAVNLTTDSEETIAICQGTEYIFPDQTIAENVTENIVHVSALQTEEGCNYNITTSLEVYPTFAVEETVEICEGMSMVFPDENTVENIVENMIYVSNLQTEQGCANEITTSVFVNFNEVATAEIIVCFGSDYTFPDGTVVENITAPLTQESMMQTEAGCERVVTTIVDVNATQESIENVAICEGSDYTFPDNTTMEGIMEAVSYESTIDLGGGCFEIITTNIAIDQNQTTNETIALCGGESYTFPDGTIFESIAKDFVYTSMLQTAEGCNHTVNTAIEVVTLENAIEISNTAITVLENNATYQWVDCNDGNAEIEGATGQTFVPTEDGNYACIISNDLCETITECTAFSIVGIEAVETTALKIFPNPVQEILTIESEAQVIRVEILDMAGKIVRTESNYTFNVEDLPAGVYVIKIQTILNSGYTRFVKK